jgi:hypothetical protein
LATIWLATPLATNWIAVVLPRATLVSVGWLYWIKPESDVYQFDFSFDQIKLEIPANQGRKDQTYQAMVTWNLVTGP